MACRFRVDSVCVCVRVCMFKSCDTLRFGLIHPIEVINANAPDKLYV